MFTHFLNVFAALACYRNTKNSYIIHKHELPSLLSLLLVFYHAFSKNEKVRKPFIRLTHYILQSQKITFFSLFSARFHAVIKLFSAYHTVIFYKKAAKKW